MDFMKQLARKKKRRILVLSPASAHSSLQCVYVEVTKDGWHVVTDAVVPYPQKLRGPLQDMALHPDTPRTLREIASLDNDFSLFVVDCARSQLSQVTPSAASPDVIVFIRLDLWKGDTDSEPYTSWNLHIGEPQLLASALKAPVFTDLVRHDILLGGSGSPPFLAGDFQIAGKIGPLAALVNIGLLSRMTIIDTPKPLVLADSCTGPGTCLINKAARKAGCEEGFDRDGAAGSTGTVDTGVLEHLASYEWFSRPAPKQARLDEFDALLEDPALAALPPLDALATVTALSARTIFNFFKHACVQVQLPEAVWVSGGGTNNRALVEHLRAYFSPMRVRSVDEIGIPAQSRLPVSLALAVNAYIEGKPIGKSGPGPLAVPAGKWILP